MALNAGTVSAEKTNVFLFLSYNVYGVVVRDGSVRDMWCESLVTEVRRCGRCNQEVGKSIWYGKCMV